MSIAQGEIEHLMKLARIKLERQEAASIAKDLAKIVEYVGELSRADTGGVEPMTGGTELADRMRDDGGRMDSFSEEESLLDQAPAKEDHYFRVPRILE